MKEMIFKHGLEVFINEFRVVKTKGSISQTAAKFYKSFLVRPTFAITQKAQEVQYPRPNGAKQAG
jgi:hypothetical protein